MGLVMDARAADHLDRRQERVKTCVEPADALALVHVRAQPRPCADARLPRDALSRGAGAATLGARFAPDCAQGAFHDYWISLRGADETTSPVHAVRSARSALRAYPRFAMACWYRYWIEQAPAPVHPNAHGPARTCRGLSGAQRAGCVAGAGKAVCGAPVAQTRLCAKLPAGRCARVPPRRRKPGVRGPAAGAARLIRECARMPRGRPPGCAAWFGRTFNVVSNGGFRAEGCRRLAAPAGRACPPAHAAGSGRS